MKTVFCISGLGADERIFHHLRIHARLKFLPWLTPLKNELITDYANRMRQMIDESDPTILGVSFGGMIGIEIARQMPVSKLIIISSVKSTDELPKWMRLTGRLSLHKILPTRSYKFTEKFDNDRLGVSSEEERRMVNHYRKNADPLYLDWAVHQVLNWKNEWYPEKIVHIHGEQDKIFPVKKIRPTHLIKEGSHIMIVNKGEEISACINSVLQD